MMHPLHGIKSHQGPSGEVEPNGRKDWEKEAEGRSLAPGWTAVCKGGENLELWPGGQGRVRESSEMSSGVKALRRRRRVGTCKSVGTKLNCLDGSLDWSRIS